MKSNALAQLSDSPLLEQLSGQDKGQVFELKSDRIAIGRNDNNDIVIVGEAVSRYHASIERSEGGGYVVRDQQSKNGVQVNGISVNEAALRDGDVVQIGSFMFRYRVPIGSDLPTSMSDAEQEGNYGNIPGQEKPIKAGPNKRVVIYSVLGVVLLLVYMMSGGEDKPEVSTAVTDGGLPSLPQPSPPANLKSQTQTTAVPGLEDPLLKGEDDPAVRRGKEIREAEQYFKKGQREYTNENYHRAVDQFRTALTLNKQHELASYYLSLSYFELEKQANKNFEIGRKYFEAMHYSRSIYHFQEVIALLEHRPGDKRIKDAEKFIASATKKLQEAQQYP